MKANTSSNFLIKASAAAIATVSVLVSVPSIAFAGPTTTSTPTSKVSQASKKTIVDIAASNKSFKTLVAAVKAAGLVETLSSKGPFTVFAPTDEAFAKLPKGTVEFLLKPENKDALVRVLTYHVVAGSVYSKDIQAGSALVKTVEGGSIKVDKTKKKVVVEGYTNVVKADIKASNGVIHVIDTVLVPADLLP